MIQYQIAGDDLGYGSELQRFGKNILSRDNLLTLIANMELFIVLMVIISLIVKVLHNCLRREFLLLESAQFIYVTFSSP